MHLLQRIDDLLICQDRRRDHQGCRRRRQPGEMLLLLAAHLHVEPRQPESRAGDHEEGAEPADLAEGLERPAVDQHARGHTEGYGVGQRIDLDAETRGRMRHPRHPAIEHIEHRCDQDRPRRPLVIGVERGHDGVEAREHARQRDEVRQKIYSFSHLSTPITSRDPLTRSPTLTMISAFFGRKMSTREPNRIRP